MRRTRIQERPIAALDQPAPDAHNPQIDQTDQHDQPMEAGMVGHARFPQIKSAALPIANHGLNPYAPTTDAIGWPGGQQIGHHRSADQVVAIVVIPPTRGH